MANYNDGKWHGWNGGECPVHPKSLVDAVWHDENYKTAGITQSRIAKTEGTTLAWSHVVKFRVVKEHKEPREFWLIHNRGRCFSEKPSHDHAIHVREVME